MSMSDIDWGDAPTWIAAVFAGLAALAAGMTLRSQRKQLDQQQTQLNEQREFIREQSANLQLEREILRADADDRKRGQARQVTMEAHVQGVGGGFSGESREYWQARIKNSSAEPIHDVSVQCGAQLTATNVNVIGGTTRTGPRPAPLDLLSARFSAEFGTEQSASGTLESERPVVFFTDNAGVRWRLDEHGDLSQVEAEPTEHREEIRNGLNSESSATR